MILLNPGENNWYTYPSLSLAHLAGALGAAGHRAIVVDASLERDPLASIGRAVAQGERVLGVTVNVANASRAQKQATAVREQWPELTVVAGGPFASSLPDALVRDWADAVVVGEGERAVVRLAAQEPFESIPGLVFRRDDGEPRSTPRLAFVDDLDSLPWPDWDPFPLWRYRFPGRFPRIPIMTSRGCPFRCINCTKVVHGYKVRQRSVGNVVGEMEAAIGRWGIREFHIWDDHLTYDVERVCQLCEAILSKGLQRKMRMALPNAIRADVQDDHMLDLLVRAGLYATSVAVESGSQRVIDQLGKRLDLSVVPAMVDGLRRRGVRVALYFMMGLPFETLDDLDATIRMACKLRAHHVHFFLATPFPGTKLYDMAEQQGLLLVRPTEFSTYDEAGPYMASPHFTPDQLRAKRAEAIRSFYCNPTRLWDIAVALAREPQDWGLLVQNAWAVCTRGVRVR